jgi:hypothetical protein
VVKTKRIVFYSLLGLLTLGFLLAGGGKALALPDAIKQNQSLHLDVWFIRLIGFLELLGVIVLWLPRFRISAAICLGVIMIGAIGAHLGAGQHQNVVPATAFFFLLMLFVAADPDQKTVRTRSSDDATTRGVPGGV